MSIKGLIESPKATKKTVDKPKTDPSPEKRVRFHGRVKRRFYERIEDEDRGNCWYTAADYSEARKFEKTLREFISSDHDLYRKNTENLNAQGVLTQEQVEKKYAMIDASIDAVVDEQEKQESTFSDDSSASCKTFCPNDEKIAEVYRRFSYEALQQAQSRANRHARHVQRIANETEGQSALVSPSRFVRKNTISRLSQRSKKSVIIRERKLTPSVFGAEELS